MYYYEIYIIINSKGMKDEIKKIVFRKNIKNLSKILLFKKKKIVNPLFDNTDSKFLNNLNSKKIDSEIMLMKSKFDYYLDKLKNNNIFIRDYKILNNNSFNNINNINKKNNNNKIKNYSLPDIFNSSNCKQLVKNEINLKLKRPKLFLFTNKKDFNINHTSLNKFRNKSLNNIFNNTNLINE